MPVSRKFLRWLHSEGDYFNHDRLQHEFFRGVSTELQKPINRAELQNTLADDISVYKISI
ncbi:hypothetical protein NTG1052_140081 [Candidatus Nitrotoga sp. 1052]|nr:hypothetical protein NTG1052_140081 [Candidatus Nitrotoga sp. 1052]